MEPSRVSGPLINNLSDGVALCTQDGNIMHFNNAMSQMFGYQESELVGENIAILMPRKIASVHHKYVQAFVSRCAVNGSTNHNFRVIA